MSDSPGMMRAERVRRLKAGVGESRGGFVAYVMYASHRVNHNYALEYAVQRANELRKPVAVIFPIIEKKPHPNLRRFRFMLENLLKMRRELSRRNIKLVVRKNFEFTSLLKEAGLVVVDRPYLTHQRRFVDEVVVNAGSEVVMVEGDVVVPVEVASQRPEPYARTIRPKIVKNLEKFLEPLPAQAPQTSSLQLDMPSWDEETVEDYLKGLDVDPTVEPVGYFVGGEDEAMRRLTVFVSSRLDVYAEKRSDPGAEACSELSPYLRWGMVCPVQVLLAASKKFGFDNVNMQSLVNEIVVWRELARNAAVFNPLYGSYDGLPEWARQTLENHASDRREHVYSLHELENAETHDKYWNAAQRELQRTGKIHNYMRMYWCKKLIEWTDHPRTAFEYAVYLNDRYGLDGVDPNSYLGISWCFGAFDRPFFETKIYGKIRKMTEESLKRKPGINKYLNLHTAGGGGPAGI
ncbi:MAG: deoxyribodipyrimidine photo-lyase [Candidatus Caldarchaeum sp.]|nr:deoxyribodipyrimidine photo-lyase [Candidatus Caldarchaeum sp.]